LSKNIASEPIRLALEIADATLADRLIEILSEVPGLQRVEPGQGADVILTVPTPGDVLTNGESGLTPRELEVLGLLSEGASNKAIARRLGISVHTAKFHVASLLDKLDAAGRTDAVTHAAKLGVINL
jgi:DNA-binding CsgD family transcriptional regulator